MQKLSYDGLVNMPVSAVSNVAFKTLNVLQNHPPHIRAASSAMMFLLLCGEYGAEPQDVFTATKNMMASKEAGHNPQFLALKLYVENETNT